MSPRTSKQFEEIREQSRNKILDAAMELFATKGFHNTSVSAIAREAGVAKGLIYNYFEKKEELMYHIVHREIHQADDFLEEVGAQEPGKPRLRFILETVFETLIERFHYQRLMIGLSLQLEHFPELKNIVVERFKNMMPMMTLLLAECGFPNPEQEGRILAAALDGIAMQYIVLKEAFPIEDYKQDLIQKYTS